MESAGVKETVGKGSKEEFDQLLRSKKKVKKSGDPVEDNSNASSSKGPSSYREKLLNLGFSMETDCRLEKEEEEMWKSCFDKIEGLAEKEVEEESDEDGIQRDKCPTLTVTAEEYMRWCAPWKTESKKKIAAWIRIPGLPIEFYNHDSLWRVGGMIGRTLKVDMTTTIASRGKFARLCVEMDLRKLLLPNFRALGRKSRIEYEGLHLLCFNCGKYGHHILMILSF